MATIKLFESWLQSQAINELAPHGKLDISVLDAGWKKDDPGVPSAYDENTNLIYERIKTVLNRNGIKFSVPAERAAKILTAQYLNTKVSLGLSSVDSWLTKTGDLKLMDFPENPAMVLTTGQFSADEIQEPADDSQGSDYESIALYCNNAALISIRYHLQKRDYSGASVSVLVPNVGYDLSTSPETGTLQWQRTSGGMAKFYGTKVTSSAVSKQTLAKTVWEVPAEGKTIVKKLPGTMFATGAATLADSKELDAAIAELSALAADANNKITRIEIQSSASGDRPAADGKKGYPANTPAGKYPLGTPYFPKTAAESGNAKLAFDRGATIQSKLAVLNAPITIKAMIQDGQDAAQFAKIIVTVEKVVAPGKTLTKDELTTILSKPKQETGLSSSKVLSTWKLQTANS